MNLLQIPATLLTLNYIMIFLWLSYLPLLLFSFKNLILNRRQFIASNLTRVRNDVHIIFQITTRSAGSSGVVERGIWAIRNSCKQIDYSNYSIEVITDDPTDAAKGSEYVVVPASYSSFKGAIRKARALQYAVEKRRAEGKNTSRYWIFHLDEESVVIPQTVLSILQFIREKKGLIAEGPIFYPVKFGAGNRLAALAESIRPFQCYDCTTQMTNPPPSHMHGSNLLVRADVEDHITWDFPKTVAEDQMFGISAYEKLGNVFGWHGGILLEQPPLSLKDHYRQRRRWIVGTLQNMKYLPILLKLKIAGRLATYLLGFASATATLALYIYYVYPYIASRIYSIFGLNYIPPHNQNLPIATWSSVYYSLTHLFTQKLSDEALLSGVLGIVLLLTSIAWLASYQIGLYWNLKFTNFSFKKKIYYHIQQFIFSPLIGVIETLPGMLAVIQYLTKGDKKIEFQVIMK